MAKLYFKKSGSGQPLIILHGLYGSSDNWFAVAKSLSQKFCVYALDMRNHGRSPHLPEHNYNVMSEDLYEFITDNNIADAVFLGHSMGGKAAMHFAVRHPEFIKKLIVVDISPRTYDLSEKDNQLMNHIDILNAFESVNLDKITDRREVDEIWKEKIEPPLLRLSLLKNIKRNKDNTFSWRLNIVVLKNNLPEMLKGIEEYADELQKFDKPVLFIKAENSGYIKNEDIVLIKRIFKTADVVTVKGASHWIHAEKPDELIDIVNKFCSE